MQTILAILKQAGGWHYGLYLRIGMNKGWASMHERVRRQAEAG